MQKKGAPSDVEQGGGGEGGGIGGGWDRIGQSRTHCGGNVAIKIRPERSLRTHARVHTCAHAHTGAHTHIIDRFTEARRARSVDGLGACVALPGGIEPTGGGNEAKIHAIQCVEVGCLPATHR